MGEKNASKNRHWFDSRSLILPSNSPHISVTAAHNIISEVKPYGRQKSLADVL